jgi:hypothetical protein
MVVKMATFVTFEKTRAKLKEFYGCRMARSRSESSIPCN